MKAKTKKQLAIAQQYCDDERDREDADYWGQYDDDDEPDYSDFDCTCGSWQWSEKSGRPIHIADCICGSSEPWG